MKIRIAGIISFVTTASITALLFYFFYKAIIFIVENDEVDPTYPISFIFIGLLFIFPISSMLYIYWTKFGKREDIELIKLERENKLLRKQIEQIDSKKDRETAQQR